MLRTSHARLVVGLVAALAMGGASWSVTAASADEVVQPNAATAIDPDGYQCPLNGFSGFEGFANGTALASGTVSGLSFTTATSAAWHVDDFATGSFDGKYPAGAFTSEQTHFATPPVGSVSPKIVFTAGRAKTFSALVAGEPTITLEARDQNGVLLATAGSLARPSGRHMIKFLITRASADIASLTLTGTGGHFFAVDSICTDAPQVPSGQLLLTKVEGPPGTPSYIFGTGFGPSENVNITLAGKFLASQSTNAAGKFELALPIPATAPPGSQKIVATGQGGKVGTATFYVHTDWDQVGYNAGRSGFNPLEKVLCQGNAGTLHQAWAAETGGRATAAAIESGAVFFNSSNAAAYAFKESAPGPTAAQIWRLPTGGKILAAPAVEGDLAFIASGDGNVYGVRTSADPAELEPTKVWTYPTGQLLTRSPVVNAGKLYFTSAKGRVYAVNTATGTAVWGPIDLHVKVHTTLALDATRLYVGADDGNVYVIARSNGAILRTIALGGGVMHSSPVVASGTLFVGSFDGILSAWSTTTFNRLWAKDTNFALTSSPTVAAGLVFIGRGDPNGTLQARSVTNGKILWSAQTGGALSSKPAFANNVVYVGTATGTLRAYSIQGAPLFSAPIGGAASEVSVTNGAVYVGSGDNHLYKFIPTSSCL